MKLRLAAVIVALFFLAVSGSSTPVDSKNGKSLELPSERSARLVLNSTTRHREWISADENGAVVRAFVVYPERSDRGPVVFLTAKNQGASDWIRAVADRVAAAGFIGVVSERSSAAINKAALALPSSNGVSTHLDFFPPESRIDAAVDTPRAKAGFKLNNAGFTEALAYLTKQTDNKPVYAPNEDHSAHMAMAMAMMQQGGARGGQAAPAGGARGGGGGLANKAPNLPASIWTASSTLARTKLRHEWVDIPVGNVKLHTWIEYPDGNAPAGVVIVMEHGTGMDDPMRGVADQLAYEGFIAVAPDLHSGLGPNGGNIDSFKYPDDIIRANGRRTADENMQLFKAARDYALKLPRANGKSASIGQCAGGGNSFRFATEVPGLSAAVVFYGGPPDDAALAKINAPVIGFYGEDDARITSTVEPTAATMKRLGKSYESHVYPGATHEFILYQVEARNGEALADAWPRAMAFLHQHLN